MDMQPAQWHQVPGVEGVRIYPCVRKPDVISSNSILLRYPRHLLVIDPGGRPEQTQSLVELVRESIQGEDVPVRILLTHCHVDHSLETIRNELWRSFPGLNVAIHERGAEALLRSDRRLTQAEILGCDLPSFRAGTCLFQSERRQPGAGLPPPGAVEWMTLDGATALQAFYTPGHSPDGVSFRVGPVLMVGDLLVAVSPLIAGAPGWDQETLVRSLQGMLKVVEAEQIQFCLAGHGNLLIGPAIPAAFDRVLKEALALSRIETADAKRVTFLSESAQALCEQLSALFGKIQRAIDQVAEPLCYLEEFAAAQQVRQILRSDEVSELLAEFRNFQEGFFAGEHIRVEVALKGVQVALRISRLLEYDKLARIVDAALLGMTRLAIADFLQSAKGLQIEEPRSVADLGRVLTGIVHELTRRLGPASLEEVPDDPAGFSQYLIASLAAYSNRKAVRWRVEETSEPAEVFLASGRFHDTLKCLLVDLADAGALEIDFRVRAEKSAAQFEVEVDFGQPFTGWGEAQLTPYRGRLARMGIRLAVRYLRKGLTLDLSFSPAGGDQV
jgi:glyoxylase-like metal-dependent hydrolase (beta-lactamase superfamily II)